MYLHRNSNGQGQERTTYRFSTPFRKGNHVSNWSRWVRPCTITTGIRNKIVRAIHATTTANLQIHLFMNDEEKKGQWTSWGPGACSVTHSVGLTPCWMCRAIAAPYRELKDTKAAATSYMFGRHDRRSNCIKLTLFRKQIQIEFINWAYNANIARTLS